MSALRIIFITTFISLLTVSSNSFAGACKSNSWTPTFVHDNDCQGEKKYTNGRKSSCYGGPYYVKKSGSGYTFIKLKGYRNKEWKNQACKLIKKYGLRNSKGYTSCQNYTRVQCSCYKRHKNKSNVCRAFLNSTCSTANGKLGQPWCSGQ